MATSETIRIFKGANELQYSKCKIVSTNDFFVNKVDIDFLESTLVSAGDTLDFKKTDGVTTIFSARVIEKRKNLTASVKAYSSGYELTNIRTLQIYDNKSPEFIVQDLVDNLTSNLTYASTDASGITITKYVAKGYLIDIINEMLDILDWQLRIDESGNVYFEPKGEINNGVVYNQGTEINITSWGEDASEQVNKVTVVGQQVTLLTQETFAAAPAQASFTLGNKPSTTVTITQNGVEITGGTEANADYRIEPDDLKIIFNIVLGGADAMVVDYGYDINIKVEDQDDPSIATYGEIEREIRVEGLDNFSDARQYARNVLLNYKDPKVKAKGFIRGIIFDIQAGETIRVIDSIRGEDEELVITKLTWNAEKTTTEMELGSRDFMNLDWQKEVQDRIKKIERRLDNDEDLAVARTLDDSLSVTFENTFVTEFNYGGNAFTFDHPTLGLLRDDLTHEVDASLREHDGTWVGTNVATGAQFGFSDYTEDIIGRWRFNDNLVDTVVVDAFSTADGTSSVNTSTISATGKFSKSLLFPGDATTYIDMLNTIMDTLDDFGLDIWYKTSDLGGTRTILSCARAAEFDEFRILFTSTTNLRITVRGTDYDYTVADTSDAAWHHIALSRSGTTLTTWLDGVSLGNKTVSTTALSVDAGGFIIGQDQDAVGGGFDAAEAWDGNLENLRIFDDALTQTKVDFLYANTDADNVQGYNGTFNGTDHTIDLSAHSADEDFDIGEGSIAFWIRPDSGMAGTFSVIMTYRQVAVEDYIRIIYLKSTGSGFTGANTIYISAEVGNSVVLAVQAPDSSVPVDEWSHVVINQTGSAISMYINGVLVSVSGTNAGTWFEDVYPATIDFKIGHPGSWTYWFDGSLDEFLIFRDPLNATEIARVFNRTADYKQSLPINGWWKLDGDYTDSTHNGFDGTTGQAPSSDTTNKKFGSGSYYFDGTGEHIVTSTSDELQAVGDFTVSCWFKRDGTYANDDLLFANVNAAGGGAKGFMCWLGAVEDIVIFKINDGVDQFNISSTTVIQDDDWHHVVIIIDRTANSVCKLYLDGVDETTVVSGDITDVDDATNSNKLSFGTGPNGTYLPFKGNLDEIKFWDVALSENQIFPAVHALLYLPMDDPILDGQSTARKEIL